MGRKGWAARGFLPRGRVYKRPNTVWAEKLRMLVAPGLRMLVGRTRHGVWDGWPVAEAARTRAPTGAPRELGTWDGE